jgi:hypothetical protein
VGYCYAADGILIVVDMGSESGWDDDSGKLIVGY